MRARSDREKLARRGSSDRGATDLKSTEAAVEDIRPSPFNFRHHFSMPSKAFSWSALITMPRLFGIAATETGFCNVGTVTTCMSP